MGVNFEGGVSPVPSGAQPNQSQLPVSKKGFLRDVTPVPGQSIIGNTIVGNNTVSTKQPVYTVLYYCSIMHKQ